MEANQVFEILGRERANSKEITSNDAIEIGKKVLESAFCGNMANAIKAIERSKAQRADLLRCCKKSFRVCLTLS